MKLTIDFDNIKELRRKLESVFIDLAVNGPAKETRFETAINNNIHTGASGVPVTQQFTVPVMSVDELNDHITPHPVVVPAVIPAQEINEPDVEDTPPIKIDNSILDSNGLPWDSRIHADSRGKSPSGAWSRKRRLEPALIAQVEAELKAAVQNVAPIAAAVIQEPIIEPVQVVAPTVPPAVTQQPALVPPTPEVFTKHAHTFESFKQGFIITIASLITDGEISQEYVNQLKLYFQVKEIYHLVKEESKLLELYENFCNEGLITRVQQ